MTTVLCIRHPDHDNEFITSDEEITILDMDLGSGFDGTADNWWQFADFAEHWLEVANKTEDTEICDKILETLDMLDVKDDKLPKGFDLNDYPYVADRYFV